MRFLLAGLFLLMMLNPDSASARSIAALPRLKSCACMPVPQPDLDPDICLEVSVLTQLRLQALKEKIQHKNQEITTILSIPYHHVERLQKLMKEKLELESQLQGEHLALVMIVKQGSEDETQKLMISIRPDEQKAIMASKGALIGRWKTILCPLFAGCGVRGDIR